MNAILLSYFTLCQSLGTAFFVEVLAVDGHVNPILPSLYGGSSRSEAMSIH